jgi:preprotein translocase subunit SecE
VPVLFLFVHRSSPVILAAPSGVLARRWAFLRYNPMAKFGNYVQEAYDELVHKVSWPSWDELQQTTIIVLVSLLIITALIFGMDFASEHVLQFIYGLLGK